MVTYRLRPGRCHPRGGRDPQFLGPDQRVHRPVRAVAPDRQRAVQHPHLPVAGRFTGNPVHRADELGHERRGRLGVQLARCGQLLQPAAAHHAHPVGHGQGLLLIVGDEQGGGVQPLLQRADLLAQLQPDLGVQRGQWLVQQQHARLDGQRAGQRDPLLLAARQLVRVLLGLVGQPDHVQQLGRLAAPLRAGLLPHPQPEGHVVHRRHVREQAVALEHHAHVPAGGRDVRYVLAVHRDRPDVRGLEAGQDAQRRGLPAARGPEQRHQLAGRDVQREAVQCAGGAEEAAQVLQ